MPPEVKLRQCLRFFATILLALLQNACCTGQRAARVLGRWVKRPLEEIRLPSSLTNS